MRRLVLTMSFVILAGVIGWWPSATPSGQATAAPAESAPMMIVHNVYFTLNESTPENREKLLADCRKYLSKHPGVVFFACGTLSDFDRPVNDRGFDVGLHVVFKDRAAHDAYQVSADHIQFIEANRASWKQVRVFDSDAAPTPGA